MTGPEVEGGGSVPPGSPEPDLSVGPPPDHVAGVPAVAKALRQALQQMGPARTVRTLTKVNQHGGFDCMSCAWPDPEHRHTAEFCENGAKAVAAEATKARVSRAFFAEHSVDDLATRPEHWLGKQGRLVEPMIKRSGSRHYEPVSWDEAFATIAAHLNSLDHPDQAAFYTSGRASNEAAFVYQLFARAFGTNNLPDCSNMCHESSGLALTEAIGVGKGTVSLLDLYGADLIVLAGQNPGTNHPRMLSALEVAKRRGAKIMTINPLLEAGAVNFRNPQTARGIVGRGTDLSDLHVPVRVNGDHALFLGIARLLVEWDAVDRSFVDQHTVGYDEWARAVGEVDWDRIVAASGLTRDQIEAAARMLTASRATVWCWAMGLTQHHNSVAVIRELTNLALARGDIGKPGAGLCPVRGHSNVQGDRTMGIWERPTAAFLDALADEFGFEPPRAPGVDTVAAIQGMAEGRVRVFMGLGGNFAHAAPDTGFTTDALRRTDLTVQVSTKLNRSHAVVGQTALILPTLGRTEVDVQVGGAQDVTVEDSMSVVHPSRGTLPPASELLRSEVSIVCSIAAATLGDRVAGIDWATLSADYRAIRRHIERVVPGFEDFEERVHQPGGFVLPSPPRDSRTFETPAGRAVFATSPLTTIDLGPGQLLLQTLRSHDQFNTTVYGLDDRYRGIRRGRRVVFVHHRDIDDLGLAAGDLVDIETVWDDGRRRVAPGFRVVAYNTPRGCVAAYYPETNALVPLDSVAEGSNTPTSKSVVVTLRRSARESSPD